MDGARQVARAEVDEVFEVSERLLSDNDHDVVWLSDDPRRGPVLHVASFRAPDLGRVVAAINARGYGLTFGLHSRIDDRVERVTAGLDVGNIYVNRNQIGAIVGSQPFGGEGLSGTGPKAGGPHYLLKFAAERTLTVNTTAAGGNASLLTLGE